MNVGDSRAYLVNDKLIQLTKDQTFVGRDRAGSYDNRAG